MGQPVCTRLRESLLWCCHSVVLCAGGLRKGTMLLPGLWNFIQEEAVPWHSPWCQTLQFLPVWHWCPSSCCPDAVAQKEWVCVSPKSILGPWRGDSWEFHCFFHCPNPHWFLQPEVMGTYLPGTDTLGWVVWCGAGIPHSQGIPPDFYLPHMGVGLPVLCLRAFIPLCASPCLHLSYPSGWIDFFNSFVVIELNFLTILGDTCFVV